MVRRGWRVFAIRPGLGEIRRELLAMRCAEVLEALYSSHPGVATARYLRWSGGLLAAWRWLPPDLESSCLRSTERCAEQGKRRSLATVRRYLSGHRTGVSARCRPCPHPTAAQILTPT